MGRISVPTEKGKTMNDLISRKALIAEYDRVHIGEPGKARKLIEDAPAVREWIPVSERLPEYEEPVIGWDAELRDMGIVNFIYGRFFDIIDMSEDISITHWMPLPEPPKGEG